MPDLIIETVIADEIKLLANISKRTFYDTFSKDNSKEDMELFLRENLNEEKLNEEFLSPQSYFFFAKKAGEIVGYIKLSDEEAPAELKGVSALNIARLYVTKENKGSGVGKALMQFSISFAERFNKQVAWLGVWERNYPAIDFYRRFGFEKFGEQLFVLGNDYQTDWLMKKNLEDNSMKRQT